MEPDSSLLVFLLFGGAAAAIVGIIRLRRWWFRVPMAVLTVLLSAVGGMAVVNDYYGYYNSWSQLVADFTGSYGTFATPVTTRRVTGDQRGRLVTISLSGQSSGITRTGLVYLPPQYFQPAFAQTRFPVIELVHGTPGSPYDFVVHLNVAHTLDRMISRHQMGPVVVVMPNMSPRPQFQECLNAPGVLDDTYITNDVRTDVVGRFRVSADPAEWGIAGYSAGGYCAANLALRHPSMFGASGIMDGYFRPTDGAAAHALHYDPAAEDANNPLLLASRLPAYAHPLPPFWISAGTGNAEDYAGAQAFIAALHDVEQVTLVRQHGAAHNFYAWRGAMPPMFAWMWQQIAPPDLRVLYPIAGPPHVLAGRPGRGPTPVHTSPSSHEQRQSRHRTPPVAGGKRDRHGVHPA